MARFEDIVAWQKARALTKRVYEVTSLGAFVKDYRLAAQIQSAAVSIMSNIAEGFDRKSRAEFHHFLMIAKGSCAEVRSQLYVALDVGYIDQNIFRELYEMADETARVLEGLRAQVERQRANGRNAPTPPSSL